MSAFAGLFDTLEQIAVEKWRVTPSIHWDYYPNADLPHRWRCFLGGVPGESVYAKGESGEQSLRFLVEKLSK